MGKYSAETKSQRPDLLQPVSRRTIWHSSRSHQSAFGYALMSPRLREGANLAFHRRGTRNIEEASRLFAAGYRVCLLIDAQMLDASDQAKSGSMWLKGSSWFVLRALRREHEDDDLHRPRRSIREPDPGLHVLSICRQWNFRLNHARAFCRAATRTQKI